MLCAVFGGCEGLATLVHGAKPEETYTVTFNANGGSGTPPAVQTVTADTVISLPDKGGLTSTGNVFVGWSENASGGGIIYSVGASITVTQNMVFYAQWLDGSTPQYTVTFNANGATGGAAPAPQTVYSGISITVPGQGTLVYSGKNFGGWNTQANGGGTNYAAGAAYTVTGNATLYARWQSEVQYTVTYNANGASGTAPTAHSVDPGTVITLPSAGSLTYTGRTFEGWNTNAGGTGASYAAGESYTVNANVSFYARWSSEPIQLQPPTGLNASAQGTSSIQVTWNAVSGATGYKVYRSSSAGGVYNFIGNAPSSPYTDSGLSANTTYYYKVSSVKNSEESAMSSSYASAVTQTSGGVIDNPPTQPTGLVVTSASSGSITLSWNGVSTATSYNVYRSNTQTAPAGKIATVTGTSYTNNVPAGASYFYTVEGVNSSGESPKSNMAFAYASDHFSLSYYSSAPLRSIASSTKHYYRLEVTQGASYTIEWQNGSNGSNLNLGYWDSVRVSAWQNDGTSIFSGAYDGYSSPKVFAATASGFVTVEVSNGSSSTSYNYQIYYY